MVPQRDGHLNYHRPVCLLAQERFKYEIEEWVGAKRSKDFATADRIRAELLEQVILYR